MTLDTRSKIQSFATHALSVIVVVLVVLLIVVQQGGGSLVREREEVTTSTAIIVLGAGLKPNGEPSDALMDRLRVGASLYESKLAPKILLTGDGGEFRANEVKAMKESIIGLGVPEEALLIDTRGFRTYESCVRAADNYKIYDAIVVTQRFHLGRADYLCSHLGIHRVQGVAADLQPYRKIVYFWLRDLVASWKAWWDIHIYSPKPPV